MTAGRSGTVCYVCGVYVLRQLLLFIMVLSIVPGMPELVENAVHLAVDGHVAHAESHPEGDPEAHPVCEVEDGCTTSMHHCGCHVSTPVVLAQSLESPAHDVGLMLTVEYPRESLSPAMRAYAPPRPPPRA